MDPQDATKLLDGALALTIAVAAGLLVFHRLDISAWFDETASYGLSAQSLGQYLSRWGWGSESNMLLYYVILHEWLRLVAAVGVPPTEVLLRLPSAVFAIAATVAVYLVGRVVGRMVGVVAAGLYATNFLQMILAQNARAYTLQMLLLSPSWFFLFSALKHPGRARWFAFALTTALSVYADLFSCLVIVAEVVAVVGLAMLPGPWKSRVSEQAKALVGSLLVSLVLVLPMAADSLVHGGPIWVPPAHLHDLRALFFTLSGNSRSYELLALGLGVLGLLAAASPYAIRFTRFGPGSREQLGLTFAFGVWFVVPVALSFALTQPQLNLHLFFARYLVVVVAPMSLMVGIGVSALRVRAVQVLAVLALAVVAWPPLALYYRLAQVQDIRDPVAWLQAHYQKGDGILCEPDIQCAVPVAYYFAAYPGPAHFDVNSPGYFTWQDNVVTSVTPDTVRAYEAQHSRIFFIYAPLGRDTAADAAAKQLEQVLVDDGYSQVDQTTSHATSGDATVLLFVKP